MSLTPLFSQSREEAVIVEHATSTASFWMVCYPEAIQKRRLGRSMVMSSKPTSRPRSCEFGLDLTSGLLVTRSVSSKPRDTMPKGPTSAAARSTVSCMLYLARAYRMRLRSITSPGTGTASLFRRSRLDNIQCRAPERCCNRPNRSPISRRE